MAITAKDIQKLREVAGVGMMDAKKALEACDGDFEEAKKYLREKGLAKMAERTDRDNAQGAVAIGVAGNASAIAQIKCETDFVAKSPDFVALVQDVANTVAAEGEAAISKHQERLEKLIISLKENISFGRIVRFEAPAGSVIDTYLHIQSERGVNATMVEVANGNQEMAHDIALHIAFARPLYLTRAEIPADVVAAEKDTLENISRNEGKPEAALPKIVEGRLNGYFKDRCLVEQDFAKDNKQTVGAMLGSASISRFAQVEIG
jgi:elongation factor Ts